jgi:hypothetical protein
VLPLINDTNNPLNCKKLMASTKPASATMAKVRLRAGRRGVGEEAGTSSEK